MPKVYDGFARFAWCEDWRTTRGTVNVYTSLSTGRKTSASYPTWFAAFEAMIAFADADPAQWSAIIGSEWAQGETKTRFWIRHDSETVVSASSDNFYTAQLAAIRWMLEHRPEVGKVYEKEARA